MTTHIAQNDQGHYLGNFSSTQLALGAEGCTKVIKVDSALLTLDQLPQFLELFNESFQDIVDSTILKKQNASLRKDS